jgi:6-pyruvoyltetrahydropterin/6-carboxytetrahydropterin synthase
MLPYRNLLPLGRRDVNVKTIWRLYGECILMDGIKKKITKIFGFDSAHRLYDYDGKCKNIHGHTYKLEITLIGEILSNTGMIIDFHDLEKIINKIIIDKVDHQYLNDVFKFNPTCENLAVWIWNEIKSNIKNEKYFLSKVVLWETPTSFITLEL